MVIERLNMVSNWSQEFYQLILFNFFVTLCKIRPPILKYTHSNVHGAMRHLCLFTVIRNRDWRGGRRSMLLQ